MVTWIFNPGYEPSAKLGMTSYTAPGSVRRFRTDCAPLLLYLSAPGDRVLLYEPLPEELMHPRLTTEVGDGELSPWGWAPEVKRYGDLPYRDEEMYFFASRERSVELWQSVYVRGDILFEPELTAPRIIPDYSTLPPAPFVLKELFSSSGRGISFVSTEDTGLFAGERPRVVEPMLELIEDVGVEFERQADGSVRYLGLSRMENSGGRYSGNHLHLHTVPHPQFQTYVALLTEVLQSFDLGGYRGYFGVDTATYRGRDGAAHIWPAVEINVRPTMGHVALALEQRYPTAVHFEVRYFRDPEQLPPLVSEHPLYLESGQTPTPGWHLLTPLLPDTHFVALLRTEER